MNFGKIALAMEVPTAHLEELKDIIDIHFVISTECLKDPAYYNFYKKNGKDLYVMLDNGTFEEGSPIGQDQLAEIAMAIRARVVWAPDHLLDADKTLEDTYNFKSLTEELGNPWKVGGIPQGPNPKEVAMCYEVMQETDMVDIYGLSFLNDRKEVCRLLDAAEAWDLEKPHHFLGLYDLQEIEAWPAYVTSMDTVKPFKAAYHGLMLDQNCRGLGKWNTHMNIFERGSQGHMLLHRNIARLHKALTWEEPI